MPMEPAKSPINSISAVKNSSDVVTPLLELRGVHKTFGTNTVLNGVDLTVHSGEAIAIIGPSGTGKSTILRLICGLLAPDQGDVYINGSLVSTEDIQEANYGLSIGMVFQNAALFDSLTVAENIGFSLFEHSRLSRREIYRLVEHKLALVGLENISDRYPSQLSGGMRKRVSFARAIMDDPTTAKNKTQKVLLYDEPTAGLDPVASTIIEDLMRSLREQQVCDSYIVVTHQDSTIRRTSDRLIVLYRGSVRYAGNVSTIDDADNPYVRQFFSGSTEGPIQLLSKEV
jgi:phospholipid/cholesterol/gamma-HCH transport system ATP-binding protein